MDAHTFHTLPLDEREQWAKRLREQWQVELNEVRDFWYNGTVISAVTKYQTRAEGGGVVHRITSASGAPETVLLGTLDGE